MASNLDFLVAFLMGILPGLLILWASLRRFDRPHVDHTLFDDRRVFGSLAVGLIFGTVASIFAIVLPRGDLASFGVAVAVSFVFEESFKLVWLNRRSYRGRFDTTFYGVPLGIGAAASGVVAAAWALRAVAVRLAHGAFLSPFLLQVDEPYAALSVVTSAGFALLIYYYVYREILPGTLPDDIRRELRRERRRAPAARD